MTAGKCFALLAPTALAGVVLGGVACLALHRELPAPDAWLLLGGGVLLATLAGTFLIHRYLIAPHLLAAQTAAAVQTTTAERLEAHRRLRHDIRGALSPALLTADRLLTHAEPAVQRAGDIMVRAIEKAAALLNDPPADAAPTPPDQS